MEEKTKTKTEPQTRLSYEQLKQAASDLYQQNQQLMTRINQLQEALNAAEFNKLSFFVSMLFKVMDHSDSYKPEFVLWCVESIETALMGFAETYYDKPSEKSEPDNKEKKTDEAE